MIFQDLDKAKKYAKDNAPKTVSLGGMNLKIGCVEIETPIGFIRVVVGISGASGQGSKRPSVRVTFKDMSGGSHSQSHLQKLINRHKAQQEAAIGLKLLGEKGLGHEWG
jgi:hypothetical protein